MTASSFDYFEHEADIGIIGRGPTLETAFVAAAQAMFAIMADPAEIQETLSVTVEFGEDDPEYALVTWLNRLLTEARVNGAVFSRFELEIEKEHYVGAAYGTPWNTALTRGTEVKGATLTALSAKETLEGWEARCVVDV
jgi:SHS2 domain-containing protein